MTVAGEKNLVAGRIGDGDSVFVIGGNEAMIA